MTMNQLSNRTDEQPLAPLLAELHQRAAELGIPFYASVFDQTGQTVVQTAWHFPEQVATLAEPGLAPLDMAEVIGQQYVKRALEVAASGGHNVLLIGAKGSGKRFLARMLPSLLTDQHGASPLLRAPHHSISFVDFVGGGQPAQPGEMSSAHGGVLFLRQLPAFQPQILDALAQAVEEQLVTIGRGAEVRRFPAHFRLLASMEPCPCGFYGDPVRECSCMSQQIVDHQQRVKEIVDCFDVHVEVPRLRLDEYEHKRRGESSAAVRARVGEARAIQERRFVGLHLACNAEMRAAEIAQFCETDSSAQRLWKAAMQQLHLSIHDGQRLLKLARTIADLADSQLILANHVAEAVQYRPRRP